MEPSEDQVYVDRVKAGDSLAYAFLVDKYKNMAFTIALKVTGNREEAEDVAQEGFLKAYQQIGAFAGRSRFSTWLYTIVYRTALNHRHKNRNHPFSLDPQAGRQPVAHTTPANEQLQAKQEQQYVKEAIDRLPPGRLAGYAVLPGRKRHAGNQRDHRHVAGQHQNKTVQGP
jgi:RNA polymerase sigma-70 factor (ECF subfamily)